MKNLRMLMMLAFMALITPVMAQTATPQQTKDTTVVKTKKDGTPDRRYSENKKLKKDGTPDKRYKTTKVTVKTGSKKSTH